MKEPAPYLKETDAWSTVLFADPVGAPLAKLLSHTPIHPNVITFFSLVPGLACVYFFWKGDLLSLLWGGLLFWFAWILDCTDGKLARLTGKFSDFGGKLDPMIDKIRKVIALGALSWGAFREYGLFWAAATAAGVVFHYAVHFYVHHTKPKIGQQDIPRVPADKRLFRRIGQYYTAYEEQFFILFIGPVFCWLIPNLVTYMLWSVSLLYLVYMTIVKIRKGRGER